MRRAPAYLAGFGLAGLLLWGLAVEPYRLEVHRVTVRDPYFARALAGLTVVQLSDLHLGAHPGPAEDRVRAVLAELKPDLILLTGDYIEWRGDYAPALEFLGGLRARLGVYGVLGDYDWSRSRQACLFCHEPGSGRRRQGPGAHLLKDDAVVVCPNGREVWITALDPEAEEGEDGQGPAVVARPTIMLIHDPLQFDRLRAKAPLLCLAGDTHGGQVRLPSWLWRLAGYENCARYREGLFRRAQATLFVSRGIGTSHLPVRLGEPPEVSVFRFEP